MREAEEPEFRSQEAQGVERCFPRLPDEAKLQPLYSNGRLRA